MKTLKEIAAAIDALPVGAFAKWEYGSAVKQAIERGYNRWHASQERVEVEQDEETKRWERRARDIALRAERHRNVLKWLTNGELTKGTFIKVSGARDGKGVREFISASNNRLVCRQWLPVFMLRVDVPSLMHSRGFKKVDGKWYQPADQMTSHEFNKVVKILG
jgi:hypothetical protein